MTTTLPVEYDSLSAGQRRQVRVQYAQQQHGLCWYCKAPLRLRPSAMVQAATLNLALFPPGFLTNPVHLHHDHRTGLTIGAVHAKCNAVLWQYHGQ